MRGPQVSLGPPAKLAVFEGGVGLLLLLIRKVLNGDGFRGDLQASSMVYNSNNHGL